MRKKMKEMTGKERIAAILRREETDRIGVFEHFWGDTGREWSTKYGCQGPMETTFGLDMCECWPTNLAARLDFQPEVIAEDENTYTVLDGNWATLRRYKHHDTTPEHIRYEIDTAEKWETMAKPLLTDESQLERRINFAGYRNQKRFAEENGLFFVWSGVNVFECVHPLVGHVEMLAAMIYDPDWVKDMMQTYADLTIRAQKLLFEREGLPDGIWYYEDMGYKGAPFCSPAFYDEFLFPHHKATIDFAHSLGLPVIMHSCGFVEPLLDGMVRAGIDCLEAMEVKAGMDLLRIYEKYGDRIALMGGIDVREIISNDRNRIDAELTKKIPVVMQNHGFVLHSDHSIPKDVTPDTFRYFLEKGKALGTYHS